MGSLVKEAIECLSAKGGRMTAQRRLILEALEKRNDHPSAEDLYEEIRQLDADINLSTVYRTLRWLEQVGLVNARRFGDERGQERFDPAHPSEHFHFICHDCKQVIEFSEPLTETIKDNFAKHFAAQVDEISVVLYGICRDCSSNRKD